MLVVCIFLASLLFSLLIQALQTLIHIDQQDTMHHPILVLILTVGGLLLNGLCYALIGGYTFHQGSFLHINSTGDVVLDRIVVGNKRSTTAANSSSGSDDNGEIKLNHGEADKNEVNEIGVGQVRSVRGKGLEICRDLCSECNIHNSFIQFIVNIFIPYRFCNCNNLLYYYWTSQK